jgi:hypothetical protein
MKLNGSYTVFFTKHDDQSPTNQLLEQMAHMNRSTSTVKGSILVVKQTLEADKWIIDITKNDMLITNFIISR